MQEIHKLGARFIIKFVIYSDAIYEINGTRYTITKGDFVLGEKPQSINKVRPFQKTTHYESVKDGTMDVEVYQAGLEKLKPDEDGIFSSLEQEFEYKKYLANWKAVNVPAEEIIPIEFVIYDIEGRNDNEYIRPMRLLGEGEIKDGNALYRYTPNPYRMAQQISSKYGFKEINDDVREPKDEMTWSVPDHSKKDLRFVKIGGNYAKYDEQKFFGVSYGKWEECEARYKEHYQVIENIFSYALVKINAKGKTFNKVKMIEELEKIKNSVKVIDAKRNSKVFPFAVARSIDALIEQLIV